MIDYYDHIDDYVNGQLQGKELKAFEVAMGEDEALAAAVENHDVAMGVIGSLIEEEVRGVIGEEEKEGESKDILGEKSENNRIKVIKNTKWKYVLTAASLVGLMILSTLFIQKNNQEDKFAKRYQEIEKIYIKPSYDIERGGKKNDPLEKAIASFNQNKYDVAQKEFKNLVPIKYDKNELNFYNAHVQFKLKQFSKSNHFLSNIETSSKWYERSENLRKVITYITAE